MDCDNDFVISLPCNILFFRHVMIWDLKDHMAAAIYLEAFDFVIPKLPVDRSLGWKGSFTIAFKVILFLENNIAQRTAGKISLFLGRLLTTFNKRKAVFFFKFWKNRFCPR